MSGRPMRDMLADLKLLETSEPNSNYNCYNCNYGSLVG